MFFVFWLPCEPVKVGHTEFIKCIAISIYAIIDYNGNLKYNLISVVTILTRVDG